MKTIIGFQTMKQANKKISMVTCYDYWSANIINSSDIDCVLVGDSAAMVMHGFETTIPATVELLTPHIKAVARGAPDKFIIGDMPFLSYRKNMTDSLSAIQTMMQAGAQAIKLEGAVGNLELVKHVVTSGVPIIGHLGLTPQSIHQLGGFRVQGKEQHAIEALIKDALALQEMGCFALLLECVPSNTAKMITEQLNIPTIGIGAGPHVDGQVLVLQDLLGMSNTFKATFLKQYLNGHQMVQEALNAYDQEVKHGTFPAKEHCF